MHMWHSVQTRRCRRRRRGTSKRTTVMRNLLRYSLLRRCVHDMKGRRPCSFNLSAGVFESIRRSTHIRMRLFAARGRLPFHVVNSCSRRSSQTSHTQLQRQHWSASRRWSVNRMHLTPNVSRHGIFRERRLLLRL